jgi:hypothetical protein
MIQVFHQFLEAAGIHNASFLISFVSRVRFSLPSTLPNHSILVGLSFQ